MLQCIRLKGCLRNGRAAFLHHISSYLKQGFKFVVFAIVIPISDIWASHIETLETGTNWARVFLGSWCKRRKQSGFAWVATSVKSHSAHYVVTFSTPLPDLRIALMKKLKRSVFAFVFSVISYFGNHRATNLPHYLAHFTGWCEQFRGKSMDASMLINQNRISFFNFLIIIILFTQRVLSHPKKQNKRRL